jgi:hypothetical protein
MGAAFFWVLVILGLFLGIGYVTGILDFSRSGSNKTLAVGDDWAILANGKSGNLELERSWLRVAQEVFDIFCEKQHDYGPNNIAVGGVYGLVFRISDKISRLWELTGLKDSGQSLSPQVCNESLEDTFNDIGDYGIMGRVVLDGNWPGMTVDGAFGRGAIINAFKQLVVTLSPDEKNQLIETLVASEIAETVDGVKLII